MRTRIATGAALAASTLVLFGAPVATAVGAAPGTAVHVASHPSDEAPLPETAQDPDPVNNPGVAPDAAAPDAMAPAAEPGLRPQGDPPVPPQGEPAAPPQEEPGMPAQTDSVRPPSQPGMPPEQGSPERPGNDTEKGQKNGLLGLGGVLGLL